MSETSSVAATETLSCISANSSSADVQEAIDFFNAYPSMTINVQGTRNGTALTMSFSYKLLYVSSTTYKVNATDIEDGTVSTAIMWILKSGSVLAMYYNGKNNTNSAAVTNRLVKIFSPVAEYEQFGTELSSSSSYFSSTGTSTVTISGNTFTVTNYTSTSPNVTIPLCAGYAYALSTYKLSAGTPTGSNLEITPYMEIAGSNTHTSSSGTTTTTTFDFTIQITAFTLSQ